MEQHCFVAETQDGGKRADVYLTEQMAGVSRSGIQALRCV